MQLQKKGKIMSSRHGYFLEKTHLVTLMLTEMTSISLAASSIWKFKIYNYTISEKKSIVLNVGLNPENWRNQDLATNSRCNRSNFYSAIIGQSLISANYLFLQRFFLSSNPQILFCIPVAKRVFESALIILCLKC